MAERVVKDLAIYNRRRHIIGGIVLSLMFLFVSFTCFYAVRIFFPIVTHYGRNSLNTLPTFFTYIIPLFGFYMSLLYIYISDRSKKLLVLRILGTVLIVISLIDLILMTFVFIFLLDGDIFFHTMTPFYPLDVFVGNGIYLLIGISCLLYKKIENEYSINTYINKRSFTKKDFIMLGFLLPFATYFVGEFMFGFIYLQEGYIDKNWYIMLPTYISFLFMGILCILYFIYHYISDKNKLKYHLISLICMYVLIFVIGLWMIIGFSSNLYAVNESMQWEFSIGLAMKIPIGLFINFVVSIPILIISTIKLYKKLKNNKNEQKQEAI